VFTSYLQPTISITAMFICLSKSYDLGFSINAITGLIWYHIFVFVDSYVRYSEKVELFISRYESLIQAAKDNS
jgi:hypothetical protein